MFKVELHIKMQIFQVSIELKSAVIMKLISFKAPNTYLEGLDELVRVGVYSSRSEAIRMAIRDLLKRELNWKAGSTPASLAEVD